jgi:hypothetical protein
MLGGRGVIVSVFGLIGMRTTWTVVCSLQELMPVITNNISILMMVGIILQYQMERQLD